MTTPASTSPAASTSRSSSPKHLARQLSPIVTMTATWAVRKAMITAYEKRTGQPAPLIYSKGPSPVRKVLWTVAVAATVAIIEIIVLEMLDDED